jgi:hypothetical protein
MVSVPRRELAEKISLELWFADFLKKAKVVH